MTRVAKIARTVQDEVSASTGKHPQGKLLTLAEKATIDTILQNGGTVADAIRATGRKRETIKRYLEGVREFLQGNAKTYADLHLKAAAKAADQGNATPAQWALERLGVVEARENLIKSTQPGAGLTIQIGVALPGLPTALPALASPAGVGLEVLDAEEDTDE